MIVAAHTPQSEHAEQHTLLSACLTELTARADFLGNVEPRKILQNRAHEVIEVQYFGQAVARARDDSLCSQFRSSGRGAMGCGKTAC